MIAVVMLAVSKAAWIGLLTVAPLVVVVVLGAWLRRGLWGRRP